MVALTRLRPDPRQLLAQQLMRAGVSTAPAYSPWQAAGRVAQAGAGAFIGARIKQQEEEKARRLAQALLGGQGAALSSGGEATSGGPYAGRADTAAPSAGSQGASNPLGALAARLIAGGNPEAGAQVALQGMVMALRGKQRAAADERALKNKLAYFLNPQRIAAAKDLAHAGRSVTSVNVGPTGIDYGKPEKGLAWARNPDGTVKLDERGAPIAIPYRGGSVYREEAAGKKAETKAAEAQRRTADVVTTDVRRVLSRVAKARIPVTGAGSWLSAIPGTAARDVKGLIDTIKANVGFDKLQAMRAASKTGGALGQVSELENRLLQATIGNLEQSQSQEQFVYNLKRVYNTYQDIIHGPGQGPKRYKLTVPKINETNKKPAGMTDDQWKRLQELRKKQGGQ